MQDSIKKLIKKFRDHDPLHYNNKQNKNTQYYNVKQNTVDKEQKMQKKISNLEQTIDALVTDANRIVRYYQESIQQLVNQNDNLKEQFENYKLSVLEEKKQFDTNISYLNERVDTLSSQIKEKTIQYHELFVKHEEYKEKSFQLRSQEENCIHNIQVALNQQNYELKTKIAEHHQEIERIRHNLEVQRKINEELCHSNSEMKRHNEHLLKTVEYFAQFNKQSIQSQTNSHSRSARISDPDSLNSCQVISLVRDEDRQTLEEINLNESSSFNFNGEKEVLDISEHYSKFNRTEEFKSKEKLCDFSFSDMVNSNQNKPIKYDQSLEKSFVRKRIISYDEIQNNSAIVRISSIESSDELVKQLNEGKKVQEIQQFQMTNGREEAPLIDPYKAFFILLVQCQKMNSPYFQTILDTDLTFQYDKLVEQGIPFNKWQEKIQQNLKYQQKKKK